MISNDRETELELIRLAQAGDQRVGTGGNQGLAGLGIDGTDLDFGGHGAVSDGGKKDGLYSGIKQVGRFGGGCSAFEGVFDERPRPLQNSPKIP